MKLYAYRRVLGHTPMFSLGCLHFSFALLSRSTVPMFARAVHEEKVCLWPEFLGYHCLSVSFTVCLFVCHTSPQLEARSKCTELISIDPEFLSDVRPTSIFSMDSPLCKAPSTQHFLSFGTIPHWVESLWYRRVEHWAIRSSIRSFARTAHSFACSALLASLARSVALIRSLTRSLTLELMGKRFLSTEWTRRFHIISTHSAFFFNKSVLSIVAFAFDVTEKVKGRNVSRESAEESSEDCPSIPGKPLSYISHTCRYLISHYKTDANFH